MIVHYHNVVYHNYNYVLTLNMLKAKVAHKRSGKKDLYATLGVTSAASEDEIKKVRT